ncbi:TPA: terminase, partial [Neisseria gonorrhoeae]
MALGQFDDVETSVIRSLSSASLYMFTRRMFYQRRGYVWQRANHHAPICNALERVFNGETKRLIINIPPRYSKTEIAVVNFIAWAMGRVPDCEFIHASYSAALAVNNSVQIRNLVQHEEYRAIFPDLALAGESGHHWKTTAGGVMYATGAGGTITGFGAGRHREGFGGCIIIDDPHKADEARSEVRRQNVIDWFQNTVESRKNSPDTPIILIMQRLHEKDLAGWLLDGGNGEEWEHLCLPAIQEDGTALWPEKHDIETLRRMEQAAPYVFAGQYLQRPAPPDGGTFKPDNLQFVKALPAGNIRWVRAWDLASTANGGDYTAGGRLGVTEDGRYIIANVVRGRYGADERDRILRNTAQKD